MPNDFLNQEIKAGDTVVYPSRQGARMWLSTLRVTQADDTGLTGYSKTGRRLHIKNIQNCVVIHELH